ncbi:tagaturonate epimerase family protein [Sunxiuqinia indica]|uniref:tagaturonate epimerase family protein n=1 Tax=Sunxiuqinia indica TaxID=2692584 RepID=UPI00135A8302|nr:tagaturonate epimerase family protein [Sunxiuqinia indica]
MELSKYSFGVGDRFSHQGEAQLRAIVKANQAGVNVSPVWNKSNREHSNVKTKPDDVRTEADAAVKALGYELPYYVDADHINLTTVAPFVKGADFFTLDVAAYIGNESSKESVDAFLSSCEKYKGALKIPGIKDDIQVDDSLLAKVVENFLAATEEAAAIYKYLVEKKGQGNFIAEVSMDEVENPQTPVELFFILKMLADKGVPVQTIAPKFTGRFNKGVDYVGDLDQFAKEFEEDLMVIAYAVKEFGLPSDLKLSVHSGSDKFSIYPIMADIIKKHDKGLHIKTAGTTWLEEVIGLALSGGEALEAAKEVYATALGRKEELCAPYADVIDIKDNELPTVDEVNGWDSEKFANTLRHIPGHADYNPNFRQLIHVGYKVAAEMGERYYTLLENNAEVIGNCVEENIFDRHLKRLFNL